VTREASLSQPTTAELQRTSNFVGFKAADQFAHHPLSICAVPSVLCIEVMERKVGCQLTTHRRELARISTAQHFSIID